MLRLTDILNAGLADGPREDATYEAIAKTDAALAKFHETVQAEWKDIAPPAANLIYFISTDHGLAELDKNVNIAHLLGNTRFELIRHDITFPLYLEIDEIFNLACPASPVHYQNDPIQTTKTSVHGAINMLGLAKRMKCKILQASTSEVYGDPQVHPQPESYWGNVNPVGYRSCYDEGKRCAETLFFDYHRQHCTRIKVARIFNTYGPNMHPNDGRVVSNFIMQAIRGLPITIYGEGAQTRSFCFVDDLVDGLYGLMNSGDDVTGPINIGNPGEFTILQLAELVIEMTGSKSEILNMPLPQDDPKQRKPDISVAQQQLQWAPKVSLREGFEKTIPYFEAIVKQYGH